MNTHMVLDVIADMKREARTAEARLKAEQLAIGIITQDIGRPQVMADNLNYWLGTDWLSHNAV